MVLNICLILTHRKVEPVRDKGLINLVGKTSLEAEEKIIRGNRKIKYLSPKYFIHYIEAGSPGWVFD